MDYYSWITHDIYNIYVLFILCSFLQHYLYVKCPKKSDWGSNNMIFVSLYRPLDREASMNLGESEILDIFKNGWFTRIGKKPFLEGKY